MLINGDGELSVEDCDLCMLICFMITLKSTCNQKAGCVIFNKENGFAGLGWSGAPANEPHCIDDGVGCDIDKLDIHKRCRRARTAVRNAVAYSDKEKLIGAEAFVSRRPEEKDIIMLLRKGVKIIHYDDDRVDPVSENRLVEICKENNAVISKIVFNSALAFARFYSEFLDDKGLRVTELKIPISCRGNGANKISLL